MKKIGFFLESGYNSRVSINSYKKVSESIKDENEIIDYLSKGNVLIFCLGGVQSQFDSKTTIMSGADIFTDGEWVWTGEVVSYLIDDKIQLPNIFIQSIRNNNYKMKQLTDQELTNVNTKLNWDDDNYW